MRLDRLWALRSREVAAMKGCVIMFCCCLLVPSAALVGFSTCPLRRGSMHLRCLPTAQPIWRLPQAQIGMAAAANQGVPGRRWRRLSDRELLEIALLPIRKLLAFARRVAMAVQAWLGLIPAVDTPRIKERTALGDMGLVSGIVTRAFAPPNRVLTYFGYGLSPFYASLPAADCLADLAVKAERDASRNTGKAVGQVRWFRYRLARRISEYEALADESRMILLQELYAEAVAVERKQRKSVSPFQDWMSYMTGEDSDPLPAPPPRSVLRPLVEGETGFDEDSDINDDDDDDDDGNGEPMGTDPDSQDSYLLDERSLRRRLG